MRGLLSKPEQILLDAVGTDCHIIKRGETD